MSKYIIELEDDIKYIIINGRADNRCYTLVRPVAELEVLNSDYINEHYGSLQDEAYKQGYADTERIWRAPSSDNEFYQKGLEDAWEAARRIVVDTDHGGLALGTLNEIFGTHSYSYIMQENTAQEAIDKIKAYDDSKHSDRIEVGDEVIWTTDNITLIATSTYKVGSINWCDGVAKDGKVYSTLIENDRKTGKHYDIQSILEAMQK